jgi:hypothetical protein
MRPCGQYGEVLQEHAMGVLRQVGGANAVDGCWAAKSAPGRLNHGKRRTPADVLVLAIANGIDREFGYRPPPMLQHAG